MNIQQRTLLFSLLIVSFIFLNFGKKENENFTLRKFEKTLGQVSSNLYASKFEVSNLQYSAFLESLQSKGEIEKAQVARIMNENWQIDNAYNKPYVETYHKHPAYAQYPVVNITQEGARLFCEWLTNEYNSYDKRKFNKVKFRLPTEEEWTTAARAGHDLAIFPWGGYYVRNSKGLFLANFRRYGESNLKVSPGDTTAQIMAYNFMGRAGNLNYNASITAPVNSFFPNDFGLHHMSGNVAEMLAEKGRTKGGSWRSSGYYIRLDAEDEFEGFTEGQPTIGFRYFMDVIEE